MESRRRTEREGLSSLLSPAVPPFHAPKVEEKTPHSIKSCHTKTDLQTRRAPDKKKIKGRQGSQPSAARETETNSRNRQQGRNSSWKVFSGSPSLSSSEKKSFSLDATLHRPILHGAARIQFQLFTPACTPS